MDLDAYSAAHSAEWERLRALAARRGADGRDADELVALYQSAATQLSAIGSEAGQTAAGDRLSLAMSRARLRFTGAPSDPLRQARVFFGLQLPAAMYRIRWATLVIALATLVIAVGYGAWIVSDPQLLRAIGTPSELREYADHSFVDYYSESSESVFAVQVWSNNAFLAALSIVLGFTGVWPIVMIFQNAMNIGIAGGVLVTFGHPDYLLYLAPHGQLELYAIFLAAATGLRIFWSLAVPGPRTRMQAIREDGRALFTLVIGCAIALLISGVIEGAVTRQDWPFAVKIGIGTLALAVVVVYQWVIGGRAWRAGQTGDLDETEAGARQLVEG